MKWPRKVTATEDLESSVAGILGVVLEARPCGIHRGRVRTSDGVGPAFIRCEQDCAVGGDSRSIKDGPVDFDLPFDLARRRESC